MFPEYVLQMAVIQMARRLEGMGFPLTVAGDQNAAQRTRASASIAKATGMTAGEPDVRVYLDGGRMLHVELKTATGRLSVSQKDRQARLRALGHEVVTVAGEHPLDVAREVSALLAARVEGLTEATAAAMAALAASNVLRITKGGKAK